MRLEIGRLLRAPLVVAPSAITPPVMMKFLTRHPSAGVAVPGMNVCRGCAGHGVLGRGRSGKGAFIDCAALGEDFGAMAVDELVGVAGDVRFVLGTWRNEL